MLKTSFIIFLLLIGLSSLGGGIALLSNRSGIPLSDLEGTIFSSYLWPGIILAVIVGGTHFAAAWMIYVNNKYQLESAAIAGFSLTIWMFTEICMVGYHSWFQPLYFVFAVITLVVIMLWLKNGIIKTNYSPNYERICS